MTLFDGWAFGSITALCQSGTLRHRTFWWGGGYQTKWVGVHVSNLRNGEWKLAGKICESSNIHSIILSSHDSLLKIQGPRFYNCTILRLLYWGLFIGMVVWKRPSLLPDRVVILSVKQSALSISLHDWQQPKFTMEHCRGKAAGDCWDVNEFTIVKGQHRLLTCQGRGSEMEVAPISWLFEWYGSKLSFL